jgi:RES domain
MADRSGAGRTSRANGARTAAHASSQVPDPPAVLRVTPCEWGAGKALHRIHLDQFAGDAFNPGLSGNARFSPIVNAAGRPIPTLYGGTTFECSAMETVFHDVPFVAGLKTFDKRKLLGQQHSVLLPTAALTLADLRNVPLRKLGVPRGRLIDTEKDTYAQTRKWAAAIHAQYPKIQGLCWTSRQDDRATAAMLFGNRLAPGALALQAPPRSLLRDSQAYTELLALADAIGLLVVDGLV